MIRANGAILPSQFFLPWPDPSEFRLQHFRSGDRRLPKFPEGLQETPRKPFYSGQQGGSARETCVREQAVQESRVLVLHGMTAVSDSSKLLGARNVRLRREDIMRMNQTTTCPRCKTAFEVLDNLFNTVVSCPSCTAQFNPWGYMLFQMAASAQNEYAMDSLVKNEYFFARAVVVRKQAEATSSA